MSTGLTTSQVNDDFDFILSDLGGLAAKETASFFEADGTTSRGTAAIIRMGRILLETPEATGWAQAYQFSIVVGRDDAPSGLALEDVIVLTDGRYRVLDIKPGPARVRYLIHLGDEVSQ